MLDLKDKPVPDICRYDNDDIVIPSEAFIIKDGTVVGIHNELKLSWKDRQWLQKIKSCIQLYKQQHRHTNGKYDELIFGVPGILLNRSDCVVILEDDDHLDIKDATLTKALWQVAKMAKWCIDNNQEKYFLSDWFIEYLTKNLN